MRIKEATDLQRSKLHYVAKVYGAGRLPCLNSNNSIGTTEKPVETGFKAARPQAPEGGLNDFSTSYRKSAYALELNVRAFIDRFGLDRVGFLTLTFADDVQCPKEAQRRFNSLRTNFLRHHYPHYIRVIERTKSGRIHYHLIVATRENIRRGLNFRAIAAKDYRSANAAIRAHWKRLREAMPRYGFGRPELLPVKTNSKGLAAYVAKYIGKHIGCRKEADKGVRLCQTSNDKAVPWKAATSNFQFVSAASALWRQKLRNWVQWFEQYRLAKRQYSYAQACRPHVPLCELNYPEILRELLGSKWAFLNRETILAC